MRIRMTNKLYAGEANVLPEDVAVWKAAGWVVKPSRINPKNISKTKGDDK